MKTSLKISFVGFLMVAVVLAGNGIMYLLATKVMPYHLTAMGSSWENLAPGIQVMVLNFMKAAGAGMLTTSIAILFLLFIPFRRGESWSRWVLLVISLNEIILIMFRVIDVSSRTPANPPLIPYIVIGVVALISFILSIGMNKQVKN